MKICILGNSVGLKIRPPRKNDGEMTYGEFLTRSGHNVVNRSRAGVRIHEAFAWFDDEVIAEFPDVVIFNFGVVEVSRRHFPLRLWYWALPHDHFLNRVAGRPYPQGNWAKKARRYPWVAISRGLTKLFSKVGLSWSWAKPEELAEIQLEMLGLLFKETSAKAIIVGLNPCSERVEALLPGTRSAIENTNRILSKRVESLSNVRFLNPASLRGIVPESVFSPDGVHFSAQGHQIAAFAIESAIKEMYSTAHSNE